MTARWKPVVGWERYEVSDAGDVRSVRGLLRPILKRGLGYLVVTLHGECGRKKQVFIHRLVLEHFSGVPPVGYQGCHRNAVRTDNRIENLYWGSVADNQRDKVLHGNSLRGEKNHRHKLTEMDVRAIKASDKTQDSLASEFGVSQVMISKIRRGKAWAHIQA